MDVMTQFNLSRFLEAQSRDFNIALDELRAGQKRSHWMWYIFPQIRGLGTSPEAKRYAISGLQEADAYLTHPVLGPRLELCTTVVTNHIGTSVRKIFGYPDDLKFRSSMTLFLQVSSPDSVFSDALRKYFDGPDGGTLALLEQSSKAS